MTSCDEHHEISMRPVLKDGFDWFGFKLFGNTSGISCILENPKGFSGPQNSFGIFRVSEIQEICEADF